MSNSIALESLPAGPHYYPLQSGKYTVAPNLHPLGRDLGQGDFDKDSVSFTNQFLRFRENKTSAFLHRKEKHFLTSNLSEHDSRAIALKLAALLESHRSSNLQVIRKNQRIEITNLLLGDYVVLSESGDLLQAKVFDSDKIEIKELSINSQSGISDQRTIDALVFLFQEDFAVVKRYPSPASKYDELVYLGVCGPSHWPPEEKIGKSFIEVHQPVPHNENLLKFSNAMIDTMVTKGPLVRFVWSFVTDNRINHHPDFGLTRNFDVTAKEPFYLRVEKQVIQSIPDANLGLFFIGINFIPSTMILSNPVMKSQLLATLGSMSEQAMSYKGIGSCAKQLIDYLEQ
jgi:hypothetical protein